MHEPSETYFVIMTMTSQTRKTMRLGTGMSIAMTPRPVATPLPPLKCRKSEHEWPTMARMPATTMTSGEAAKISASPTLSAPLRKSSKKIRKPGPLPSVRQAFVAPMLWLPYSRRSTCQSSLPKTRPFGMEPSR